MPPGPRFGVRTSVACAHHLVGAGACERPHGHTYVVEVMAHGAGLPLGLERLGMVVGDVLKLYDHRDLNEFFETPTCEIFCQAIFNELGRELPGLCLVRVWEGHAKWAETTDGTWREGS